MAEAGRVKKSRPWVTGGFPPAVKLGFAVPVCVAVDRSAGAGEGAARADGIDSDHGNCRTLRSGLGAAAAALLNQVQSAADAGVAEDPFEVSADAVIGEAGALCDLVVVATLEEVLKDAAGRGAEGGHPGRLATPGAGPALRGGGGQYGPDSERVAAEGVSVGGGAENNDAFGTVVAAEDREGVIDEAHRAVELAVETFATALAFTDELAGGESFAGQLADEGDHRSLGGVRIMVVAGAIGFGIGPVSDRADKGGGLLQAVLEDRDRSGLDSGAFGNDRRHAPKEAVIGKGGVAAD